MFPVTQAQFNRWTIYPKSQSEIVSIHLKLSFRGFSLGCGLVEVSIVRESLGWSHGGQTHKWAKILRDRRSQCFRPISTQRILRNTKVHTQMGKILMLPPFPTVSPKTNSKIFITFCTSKTSKFVWEMFPFEYSFIFFCIDIHIRNLSQYEKCVRKLKGFGFITKQLSKFNISIPIGNTFVFRYAIIFLQCFL